MIYNSNPNPTGRDGHIIFIDAIDHSMDSSLYYEIKNTKPVKINNEEELKIKKFLNLIEKLQIERKLIDKQYQDINEVNRFVKLMEFSDRPILFDHLSSIMDTILFFDEIKRITSMHQLIHALQDILTTGDFNSKTGYKMTKDGIPIRLLQHNLRVSTDMYDINQSRLIISEFSGTEVNVYKNLADGLLYILKSVKMKMDDKKEEDWKKIYL